ncbi:MAG: hypothetical protein PVF33_10060 [Candidatus Latescibacterota bacterium]|jgi:hypothetical protein
MKVVFDRRGVAWTCGFVAAVVVAISAASCGEGETKLNVNLLKNPSFEQVENGVPKHWTLTVFRGLEGQPESEYGIDNETTHDGMNSWRFSGDASTRRWYALTQEVRVRDVSHVRLRGWRQTDQVRVGPEQHAHDNFTLTFYDENHRRFQEVRLIDKKTPFVRGSNTWFEDDVMFKVPLGTRFVAVSCVLGCQGWAWFDDVYLSATQTLDWETRRTKNFVFHWVPQRPFPEGSIENQQRLFDYYSAKLGIDSDIVVNYYMYPDSAAIQKVMDIVGDQYINYGDKEIHTINPNENHEIIHLMTDDYGVPSRAILEGTVFWLHGEWEGEQVHRVAARLLAEGKLPSIEEMIDKQKRLALDYRIWMPASASFVGFLVDLWGPSRLLKLYGAPVGHNEYPPFARAFKRVYGASCEDVEKQWREVLTEFGQQQDQSQQDQSQQGQQ